MSILENIKAAQLAARKAGEKRKAEILTTLLGEVVSVGKNDGNRDTTDIEATARVKKFAENVKETIKFIKGDVSVLQAELAIYEGFLPKQLDQIELEYVIKAFLMNKENPSIGDLMLFLKKNYAGQYDGKAATQTFNKLK